MPFAQWQNSSKYLVFGDCTATSGSKKQTNNPESLWRKLGSLAQEAQPV